MQTDETAPTERRCPRCSSVVPGEARFCGICGMEVTPLGAAPTVSAAPPAPIAPLDEPPAPPVDSQSATPAVQPVVQPAAQSAQQPSGGRVCTWCGSASDPSAGARCPACGAVFPTPEGDAALERASLARIQAMESGMKPQRSVEQRSSWWPFRSR